MIERPTKAEQILKIEPKNELHFKGPYSEIVTEYLTLTNPSDKRVCFKIKTTAPKRYCVRPNNGIIDAKCITKVAVMLQPSSLLVDSQQILEFKNKHKFMVQTIYAPDDEVNQEILWKDVDPSAIMESKLKCVFDLPVEAGNENLENNKDSNPSSLSSSAKSNDDTGIAGTETSIGSTVWQSVVVKTKDDSNTDDENRKLRSEVALLREELMKVKEEGLKKRNNKPLITGPTYGNDLQEKNIQNVELSSLKNNTHILAFGLFLFILGVLFGKIMF